MATVETDDDHENTLGGMPLLDAVQSLVEKERALMQLKVAEAADEINAWKAKYNHLAESTHQMSTSSFSKETILPDKKQDSHWNRMKMAHGEGQLHNLRFIDLSREQLTESDLPFIARRMPKVASLPQLSLAHNNIQDSIEGSKGISRLLDSASFVTFDLSHNQIGSLVFVSIFGSFSKGRQNKLQSLKLNGNWKLAHIVGIGEQLGNALIKCGPVMPRLRSLKLTLSDDAPSRASGLYHEMLPKAAPPSEKLIHNNKSNKTNGVLLTTHGMSGKVIKPRKPYNALEFLKKFQKEGFPKINDLSLIGTRLSRDSILELCKIIKHPSCSLTSLDLTYANIGPMGCKVLAKAVKSSIHSIFKSNDKHQKEKDEEDIRNYIGASDTTHVPGLTSLCLAHCGIASAGCQFLCQVLQSSHTLTRLDLRSNEITDVGALELAKLIRPHGNNQHNKTTLMVSSLVYLDVGENSFGRRGMDSLLQAASSSHGSLLVLKGCHSSSATVLGHHEAQRALLQKRMTSIKGTSGEFINTKVELIRNHQAHLVNVTTLSPPKPLPYQLDHPATSRLLVKARLRRSDGGPFIWRLVMTVPEAVVENTDNNEPLPSSPNTIHNHETKEKKLKNEDIVLSIGCSSSVQDDNDLEEDEVNQFYAFSTSTSFDFLKTKWTKITNKLIKLKYRRYGELKLQVCACNKSFKKLSKQQISQLPHSVTLVCEDLQCYWTDNVRDLIPNSAPISSSSFINSQSNSSFGQSFQYQDSLIVQDEMVKEPVHLAKQIKNCSDVDGYAQGLENDNYDDQHLWSHQIDKTIFSKEVTLLCSLLLKFNIMNYATNKLQEHDISAIQCIRQMKMFKSSASSSLNCSVKLSPKTESAAQEALSFDIALMVENDGRYSLVGHSAKRIKGSDLWTWIPVEATIGAIKNHDKVSVWTWVCGSKQNIISQKELDVEVKQFRLCCDQTAGSSSQRQEQEGEESFIFDDAIENASIPVQLNFASPYPMNHAKSGARWF